MFKKSCFDLLDYSLIESYQVHKVIKNKLWSHLCSFETEVDIFICMRIKNRGFRIEKAEDLLSFLLK